MLLVSDIVTRRAIMIEHDTIPYKEAGEEFLKFINSNGGKVSFQQLESFARRPDLRFGIGVDIVDIILTNRDLGKVDIDFKTKAILVRK